MAEAAHTGPKSAGAKMAKAKEPAAVSTRVSPWYLVVLAGSALAALAAFYLVLMGLETTNRLPPPAFSNSLCVDEKLEHMRTHKPSSPKLLVIGSSVAWRHFDGASAEKVSPGSAPYNAGFCGLFADQSVYVANWLLDRNPSVKEVLLLAVPQDFEDCTGHPAAIFDRKDADEFVYGGASRWRYYLRYFDPISLVRNAKGIAAQRSGANDLDPLVFDGYGAGPLDTSVSRDLTYGPVFRQDPACYAAVAALSKRLKSEGRRLMIAATPIHPDWKAQYDPQGKMVGAFTSGAKAIPASEFWDGDKANLFDKSAYTDAVHFRWSAAGKFSQALASNFHFGDAPHE